MTIKMNAKDDFFTLDGHPYPIKDIKNISILIEDAKWKGKSEKPFTHQICGGASVGLDLLMTGQIEKLIINDMDKGIYSFWYAVLNDTDKLINKIINTPITPEEWKKQKEILQTTTYAKVYDFETGFATFYLNRTNRSGIINGGMIGGNEQTGNYKIDARFNKENLIKRIKAIAEYKDKIEIYNEDAIELFKNHKWENAFVYLDPPYYQKGNQVYNTYYKKEDHEKLKECIETDINPNYEWLLSYDNCKPILELYGDYTINTQVLGYSITTAKKAKELIITK